MRLLGNEIAVGVFAASQIVVVAASKTETQEVHAAASHITAPGVRVVAALRHAGRQPVFGAQRVKFLV
jgi:UDP-N-acetyl-D-mannosaminuronic acid transferase (WecB/TagA/CpsF family)